MKIIVAIDGSPCSTFVVQSLAHFAPPEECTLVHALALPDLSYPLITPDVREEAQREITARLRQEGEALLQDAETHLPSDFSHIQRIHQIGHPVDVILDTARSAQAHLILLGARGLGPVKELILGSISHRIVLHAPCPTMVVKAPIQHIKKILLPIEGEEDANTAIQFLGLRPFRQSVDIQVFSVWPQPQLPWPTTIGQTNVLEIQALEEAQTKLDHIAERLHKMNYSCQSQVGLGNPALAILEQAKSYQPDLIIMGTHSRGGLSRFLMGSVSHSLHHQTPCPVLLVR
ncbi:MAG TPA: universal stress protein [Nitrospirales bacterium]|nr:universal stress protein [Nitrospirales bacterium]